MTRCCYGSRPGCRAARPGFLLDGHLRELLEVPGGVWLDLFNSLRGRTTVRLWSAEVWCRLMLDGEPPENVGRELWQGGH